MTPFDLTNKVAIITGSSRGIGMTMEYKVGHYFKRVTAIDTTFGDADHHLAEVGRLGGLIDPA